MKFYPKKYQSRAINFILDGDYSALFLDCGLGKTAITLSAILDLIANGEIKSVLVVAPLRVARLTWPMEIEKWDQFKCLKYVFLHGRDRLKRLRQEANIYLINYEGLLWLLKTNPRKWPFDAIVFDELTRMKSHSSVRFKRMKYKVKYFKKRIGLTGTPLTKSYLDLYGQTLVLDDGRRFGKSFIRFRSKYFYPIDYKQYNWEVKPGAGKTIERKISDMVLRIEDIDHLDIPRLNIIDVELKLPKDLQAQYNKLEKTMFLELDKIDIEAFNAASLTGKCLQFCSGAIYHNDDNSKWVRIHNIKTKAIIKIIKEQDDNEPLLISYNFRHEVEKLKRILPNALHLKSGMNDEEERDFISRWNKKEISEILCHPASAGHGLNLQQGGHIGIITTLNWSLEYYLQLLKRLHRQGQKKEVFFYRFIFLDTIEEVIATTLEDRSLRQDKVLRALKLYRKHKS